MTNASNELGSPTLQHASPALKHAKGASTATNDGSEAGGSEPGIYVQGMNVLCAPFLYTCRTEPQAFIAFHYFITRECPGYIRGAMDGVHKGVALVERCLAVADTRLSYHLVSKGVNAQIYAFASVLTMSACTPPLPEVLLLWDFLFAYGSHLNILCICSQLMMMREELLADPRYAAAIRSSIKCRSADMCLSVLESFSDLSRHCKLRKSLLYPSTSSVKFPPTSTKSLSTMQNEGYA